ncbi:helix-turn-helix transcriptional regulator [Paenibacillus sp. ACRRY]|uniref:helix-turn-helix transcriptional regulator n=1 Tax=Paenibacillus sp. ACRRY TaxID=2918208 RepID=UPI001EF4011C|nr:helix-turn-helix transcriptional regulator [Paenibacillus sp. ACRRY]MCG7381221.1 helix-turn-helix transcriptional regulator [Paenibacillus sp. ACRRY]
MKNNIRDLRKKMRISQDELAKKCGVTRQTINAIENDKYDPTLSLAFRLAVHLETVVDQLFIFEEDSV